MIVLYQETGIGSNCTALRYTTFYCSINNFDIIEPTINYSQLNYIFLLSCMRYISESKNWAKNVIKMFSLYMFHIFRIYSFSMLHMFSTYIFPCA